MDKKILFKTVHGSRLYGLHHAESDEDFYTVVDKVKTKRARYARQTISGDEDSMVVDFGTWLGQCEKGVPQALEAMFSNLALVDDISHFRRGYKVSSGAYDRYLRTITSFIMEGSFKRKRHGLRLALNMYDLQRAGRFNPTLTPNEVAYVTKAADKDRDAVYATAMNIALDRLPPRLVR